MAWDEAVVGSRLPLVGADVLWAPQWLTAADADALLAGLADCSWAQPIYHVHGRDVPMPRQVAWFGDPGTGYGYSGVRHDPLPWRPDLAALRDRVARATGARFNSVLINRYRDGRDSVAWHADNEQELGVDPTIASVSLGADRLFALKPQPRGAAEGAAPVRTVLTHGSLLVMAGGTQRNWLHQIPKTTRPVGERINLTFRLVAVR